jgi:hypothetical protein
MPARAGQGIREGVSTAASDNERLEHDGAQARRTRPVTRVQTSSLRRRTPVPAANQDLQDVATQS